MRFRFVHAADLHLDTPFSGIGQTAPAVAEALRNASLEAWDALVELALRERAAFVVLAGDLYDGPQRGIRAQLRVLAGLRRLSEHGVRVFIVHGNHDPVEEGWSAIRAWPAGVTVFPSERVDAVPVEVDGERVATVYGTSYSRREERRNLARSFPKANGPGLHVAVLHASVGDDPEHGAYAPCSLGDLIETGMDYWALGHVHRFRVLREGRPWVVYPGALQGRSPAPGELGPKGAVVVDCDSREGILGPPRFVALDRVRFARVEVDAGGLPDPAGLPDAILARLAALREEHGGRGLLVRVEVTGRVEWAHALSRHGSGEELLRHLREQLAGWSPFVWVDALALRLTGTWDRERLRGRGDFAGELVVEADALAGRPDELAAIARELEKELRSGNRAALLPPLADDDLAELLPLAEHRCLGLLLEGDEA